MVSAWLSRRRLIAIMTTLAVICAVAATARGVLDVGAGVLAALWTLALIIPVHLLQLFLSGAAWHALLPASLPDLATCFRLRTLREGINSLMPVARVGGEVVAAGVLTGRGMVPAAAGASIIVDVTIELITQIMFLLLGLAGFAWLETQGSGWTQFMPAAIGGLAAAGLLLLALRFGLLRAVEGLMGLIARHSPDIGAFGGLEAAASGIARHPARLLRAGSLHMGIWLIGGIETWLVLYALGQPVGPAQALVIESLGAAARSAGFALPGALGVQEGGFMLAAAAFGLPQTAGLSLSLIKRVREVLIGLLGLAFWRWPPHPLPTQSPSVDPAGI